MFNYIIKRLVQIIPVIIGVTIIAFFILHLVPGDPAEALAGESADAEQIEVMREKLGLNKPLIVQYLTFAGNLFKLDFGTSIRTSQPVLEVIAPRLLITIELAIWGIIVATFLGMFAGIISAIKQYSFADISIMLLTVVGMSMPTFWLALLLMYYFSIQFNIFPTSGWGSFKQVILPAISLGTVGAAMIARMMRSSMLEVIRQDYVRTARAKGLKEKLVIYKHALRNAMIPVVTVIGLQFGTFLSGAILTETVFSINGMGRLVVDSIHARDFPLVQGTIIVFAVVFVLINLIVDVTYHLLNKRIKL